MLHSLLVILLFFKIIIFGEGDVKPQNKILITSLMTLTFLPLYAQDFLQISTDQLYYNLESVTTVFIDSSETLTTNGILKQEELFTKRPQFKRSNNQKYYIYWVKFTINNTTHEREWILRDTLFSNSTHILGYVQYENKIETVEPYSIGNYKKTFLLEMKPEGTYTYYFKFLANIPNIGFQLFNKKLFLKYTRHEFLFFGLYIGAIIVIIFLSIFLFLGFRERSYIFLIFFALFFNLSQLWYLDFIPFKDLPGMFFFYICKHLGYAGVAFFSITYLSQKNENRVLTSIIRISSYIILCSLLTLFFYPRWPHLIDRVTVLPILLLLYSILILGYKQIIKRYIPAYFFMPSFILFSLSLQLNIIFGMIYLTENDSILTFLKKLIFEYKVEDFSLLLLLATLSINITYKINRIRVQKDLFFSTISHELQTPLHGIIGIAESLLSSSQFSKDTNSSLSLIIFSGKRLLFLQNDILDFSEIRNNNFSLDLKTVSLKALIQHVMQMGKVLIGTKKITLSSHIPSSLPLIRGDENRIFQMLYTLVGNAIQLTSTGIITINCETKGTNIVVTIEDSDIDIDKKQIETIFTPFFMGIGLGMVIAKKVLELHGGVLRVDSSPDKGAIFRFSFPAAQRIEVDPSSIKNVETAYLPVIPKTRFNLEGKKNRDGEILIVDDDPINLHILHKLLSNENYQVYSVQDGKSALEILKENREIAVVLLDVIMPSISGYDVCRSIREQYSMYEKPVIFLTAKQQGEERLLGFQAGANDYLTTPFNKIELLARVKSLMKLQSLTSENSILKSSNTTKTRLLEMASHGLKNPLTIIKGNLSLLSENKNYSDHHIFPILSAVDRMIRLINQFLENAKIEEGQLILNLELSNLSRLLRIGAERLKPQADNKNLTLVLNTEEPLWIEADETYFLEILDNIISNCINYSPPGKTIWISCKTEPDHIHFATILVKDEGPGISKEDLDQVFLPFRRLSEKPTSSETSTGLGLTITKQLVELHKGQICVRSPHQNGCEFEITIPRCNI